MVRHQIINLIKKITGEAEVLVERPQEKSHGDYSTNVAIKFKIDPKELAAKLASDLFEKVELAGPGFINFFISKEYLQKQVKEILRRKVYPVKSSKAGAKQFNRVNIEFVSANPTGLLHIGNGRSAFAGDVIANVLEKAGHKVTREYFVNDAKNSNQIKELGKTALGRGTVYLNKYLEGKIPKLKKIRGESEAGYLLAQEIQKDTKNLLEKKLKIKFDKWFSEEKYIYQKNKTKEIFEWLKRKNLVYEKDRAWWVKTSQFGDERDWVVIRERGEPTYLLSDIAYHKDKFDRGFNKIINIWGADHQAHVSRMKAASRMLGFRGDLDILILQLVTLKGKGKISKRKGEVITLENLVEEIGLDAARFFYLQKSLNTHMEIDLALAKEQSEKNPIYYIQYAHARICSILRKSKQCNKKTAVSLLRHESELDLIKQLIRFPEVVEDTAKDYQVQRLPQYALDLAAAFHQFYRDCKVLTEERQLSEARLALVSATKTVLKNALSLMGISAPEKM